jgi:hypothetical protein
MNMKFESVLAWGELTDTELEMVYGGGGFGGGGFGGGSVGAGAAGSLAASHRVHSFSVVCDISIFSANLDLIPIINIADCLNQTCANDN